MKNKQNVVICCIIIVLSAFMNVVDLFIQPGYFVKSVIKIILFTGVPGIYFFNNKKDFKPLKKMFSTDRINLKLPVIMGIICYIFITGGYIILKNRLDFSAVTHNLVSDVGVNPDNFVFVSLYISLCNSFLEEFFFRGFGFIILKNHTGRNFVCIFSSVMFAFYHIGMTIGWVNIYLYILGFAALITGGIIFNILDEKTTCIYPSWIVHMFINFGINTVGFILFGIL